ncbi:GDSL esterase/lipase 4 [Euphorbia peplus]|nr:GDSL esterase/lipase 4 [Euphorbia peplus]
MKMISNSLYIISVGSNDILDPFRLGTNVSKEALIPLLQSTFAQHLQNLYDMGARKFGIITVGPVGCCPSMRAMNKTQTGEGGCLRKANDLAIAFHNSIDTSLKYMSSKLPQFKYSLANSYSMGKFVLKGHLSYGFNDTINACCGFGNYNGEGFCDKEKDPILCSDRHNHLFWDLYHLSQSATNLSAISMYYGFLDFVKPINFMDLAKIQL